jgi:hypothetical protein
MVGGREGKECGFTNRLATDHNRDIQGSFLLQDGDCCFKLFPIWGAFGVVLLFRKRPLTTRRATARFLGQATHIRFIGDIGHSESRNGSHL